MGIQVLRLLVEGYAESGRKNAQRLFRRRQCRSLAAWPTNGVSQWEARADNQEYAIRHASCPGSRTAK